MSFSIVTPTRLSCGPIFAIAAPGSSPSSSPRWPTRRRGSSRSGCAGPSSPSLIESLLTILTIESLPSQGHQRGSRSRRGLPPSVLPSWMGFPPATSQMLRLSRKGIGKGMRNPPERVCQTLHVLFLKLVLLLILTSKAPCRLRSPRRPGPNLPSRPSLVLRSLQQRSRVGEWRMARNSRNSGAFTPGKWQSQRRGNRGSGPWIVVSRRIALFGPQECTGNSMSGRGRKWITFPTPLHG